MSSEGQVHLISLDDDRDNEGRPQEPKLHPWVHHSMYKWFTVMAIGTIFICTGIFWVYVPLPVASISLALAAAFFALGMLAISVALHMMRTTIRKIVQGKRLAIKIQKEVKMTGTAILPVMMPPVVNQNGAKRSSSKERRRRRREKRSSSTTTRGSTTLQVPSPSTHHRRRSRDGENSIFVISNPSNVSGEIPTDLCPPLCAPEDPVSADEKVAKFLEVSSQPNLLTTSAVIPLQQSMSTPILVQAEVTPQVPVPQQRDQAADGRYPKLDPRVLLKDYQAKSRFIKKKGLRKTLSGISMPLGERTKEKLCAKRSVQSETGIIMMPNSLSSAIQNTLAASRTPEFQRRPKRSVSDVSFFSAYEYLPYDVPPHHRSRSFGSFDERSVRTYASNRDFTGSTLSMSSISMASGYVTPPTEFTPPLWINFEKSIQRRHDIDTSGTSISSTPPSLAGIAGSSSWYRPTGAPLASSDEISRPFGEKTIGRPFAKHSSESSSSAFDPDLTTVTEDDSPSEARIPEAVSKDHEISSDAGRHSEDDDDYFPRSRASTMKMSSDSEVEDAAIVKGYEATLTEKPDRVVEDNGPKEDTSNGDQRQGSEQSEIHPWKPIKYSRFTVYPVSEEALRLSPALTSAPVHRSASVPLTSVDKKDELSSKSDKSPALRTQSSPGVIIGMRRNLHTDGTKVSHSTPPSQEVSRLIPESRELSQCDPESNTSIGTDKAAFSTGIKDNDSRILVPIASISEIDELLAEIEAAEVTSDCSEQTRIPDDSNKNRLDTKADLPRSESHRSDDALDDSGDSGQGSDLTTPDYDMSTGQFGKRHISRDSTEDRNYCSSFEDDPSGQLRQLASQIAPLGVEIPCKTEVASSQDANFDDSLDVTKRSSEDNVMLGDETSNSDLNNVPRPSRPENLLDSSSHEESTVETRYRTKSLSDELMSVIASAESLFSSRRKSDSAMNRRGSGGHNTNSGSCDPRNAPEKRAIYHATKLPPLCLPSRNKVQVQREPEPPT